MAASKLVRWLPEILPASAEDIARFGPQAARVRALLDFIPSLGAEGRIVAGTSLENMPGSIRNPAVNSAWDAAADYTRANVRDTAADEARNAVYFNLGKGEKFYDADTAADAARLAAWGEVLGDVIDPKAYRTLTGPLAAGRAVDILRRRYPEGPFIDLTRQLAEQGGAITNPRDVLAAARLSLPSEDDYRDIALMLLAEGEPLEQAIRTARNVARGR